MPWVKARPQEEREACELKHASRIKDKWKEGVGLWRYCPVCNRGYVVQGNDLIVNFSNFVIRRDT